MLARAFTGLASTLVGSPRLTVFTYHRVVKAFDSLLPEWPDASKFQRELKWLSQGFRFLDAERAVDLLYSGSLPARSAVLTLDDGYEENYDVVCPILSDLKIPCTFFLSTGFIGERLMFNDRLNEAIRLSTQPMIDLMSIGLGKHKVGTISEKRAALEFITPLVKYKDLTAREELVAKVEHACQPTKHSLRMMNERQIKKVHASGITIGAHTRNHPILKLLSDQESEREIMSSVDDLEAITGERPRMFAYPNGRFGDDFEDRHCEILSRNLKYAFATGGGINDAKTNRYRIARVSPWGETKFPFQMRQVKNLFETPTGPNPLV